MPRSFPALEVSLTPLAEADGAGLHCEFDREVMRQDATERLELTGWALDPAGPVRRVTLNRGRKGFAEGPVDRPRPRLKQRFPNIAGSESAGFHLALNHPEPGSYQLVAETADGQRWPLADIALSPRTRPRLLFMHIAKAAGSTLNAWFGSQYPADRHVVHIESHPDWPSRAWRLGQLDFLSGHVALHTLDRHLDLTRWYSVSVVRDPWAQLASHIAWIRRLSDPGEEQRLARHAEVIQKLSARLAEVDFRSERSIRQWWEGDQGQGPGQAALRLLDNCQVRYFTPIEVEQFVTEEDAAHAIEASARIDRIGVLEQLDPFFDSVARDMGWDAPRRQPRENVTGHFYGLDVSRRRIRRVLEPLVRHDLALYEHVKLRASAS